MWRHFSVLARPIWYSLFYNGYFPLRWFNLIFLITPNWNKKALTRSKDLLENLSLELLRDVIVPSLSGQFDIHYFKMSNFQSDEYPWKPNFSNHIRFKVNPLTRSKNLSENLSLKFLCDVIFLSLPGQCGIPSFKKATFQLDDYPWKPNFSNHTKLEQKLLTTAESLSENLSLKLLCDVIFLSLQPI